jgi:L-lactate dehydrogenase (cytochrome)
VTWRDIDWVREHWSGPIVLKGVLDAQDARAARSAGVEGIVVSNHGGRQLDSVPSGISALPAVADAVGADLTVLMDGGVRSGLDILKALAMGARGCLVGRAWAYALGARGGAGVSEVIEIMRRELLVAMSLTGCVDVRAATRDLLASRVDTA